MSFDSLLKRRDFLAASAVMSSLASVRITPSGDTPSRVLDEPNSDTSLDDNVYTRLLGVRPHLGAHEHISRLGGGRMSREVLNAMAEANEHFVDMRELNAAAGRRAAELLGAEAAMITAGGFSAMILGAAACLTGVTRRRSLPSHIRRGSDANASFRRLRDSITIVPIEPPVRQSSTPIRGRIWKHAWARAPQSSPY